MRYLVTFLALFSYQSLPYADEINNIEPLPLFIGIKFGSGSSNLNNEAPPLANLVNTKTTESLISKGIFIGARLFETSSKRFFISTELSSIDHGEVTINSTTTTTNYFATQTIKSTDLELIFGIQIRNNLALRIGVGQYFPKINLVSDIPNLQPNAPGWIITDPNASGSLKSIGLEAKVLDQISVVIDYVEYDNIAYDFTGISKKGLNLSTFNIKILYTF